MSSNGQKFFFDQNVFDPDDPRYTPNAEDRPRPEYTQEQLAQAKEASFEAGKIAGFKESQASLMQDIQKILQKISQDTNTLFASENKRNDLFETEAVHLSAKIFQKLFKAYTDTAGLDDLKRVIESSINEHKEKNIICIEVSSHAFAALQDFVSQLPPEGRENLSVKENAGFGKLECRILWQNGGITYDAGKISDKIFKTIQESLAVHNITVHNETDEIQNHEKTGEQP